MEKKRFTKTDKALLTSYKVFNVLIWILAVIEIIVAIIIFARGSASNYRYRSSSPAFWYYGFIPLIGAFLGTWLRLLMLNLIFGYLADVKIIRNKILGLATNRFDEITEEQEDGFDKDSDSSQNGENYLDKLNKN